ncbi:MAG: HAMP domain-containing histidine kinase [Clostridia bacterium]|nr:HAMP domain-containing histidine kinase [Clostridia bacterium]
MKFFERTYLLTLLLFLLFLNGGFLTLALYTHGQSIESAEQVCLSEEYTLRSAFERDVASLEESSDYLLQVTYGTFYRAKGIYLSFEADGRITYSELPGGLEAPPTGTLGQQTVDGKRYILIRREACDGAYLLTYAKDVSSLDKEFRQLFFVFLGVSLVASTVLAGCLYLALRRLYTPLQKLKTVTVQISQGDFSVRANEAGDDELAELAKEFNRMADRVHGQMQELKATADQKQRMLDDLAHEMRTPLTGIHGYAEYICTANVTEEERMESAQYIMREAMRLKNIGETLLDAAFIREHKIKPLPLLVRDLLSRTQEHHLRHAEAQGVEITLSLPDSEARILGDPILLELLLSNLTENAIKACRKDGRVEIGARREGDRMRLYVKDNGIGMTQEQLTHVTEPFYRTDKARSRREGGTGLGLALCALIATAHGSRLEFSSAVNDGTTVWLLLDT